MDLREVLDDYVVTAVPGRRDPVLSLVWWAPAEGVDEEDGVDAGVLAILDDYRITRVPKAS
jgi:hypothetical protein